jgi:hypothetical protein
MNVILTRYLDMGWRVLPCWPTSKIGALRWNQASSDPATIEAWSRGRLIGCDEPKRCAAWRYKYRDANWAVVLGPESGLLALDVDGMEGEAALTQLRREYGLPLAPQCNSGGAKGGFHLYFRYPEIRSSHIPSESQRPDDRPEGTGASAPRLRNHVQLAPRLELRAAQHLLMLPPSRHADTGWPYTWAHERAPWTVAPPPAPDWMIKALTPTPPAPRPHPETYTNPTGALRSAAEQVATATNGTRNDTLYRAAVWLAHDVTPTPTVDEILAVLVPAALGIGLSEQEACGTIRSAARRVTDGR